MRRVLLAGARGLVPRPRSGVTARVPISASPITFKRYCSSLSSAGSAESMRFEGGLRGVIGTLALVEEDAVYVEAWVPGHEPGTLRCGDAWAAKNALQYAQVRKVHESLTPSSGLLVDAMKTTEIQWAEKVTAEDLAGLEGMPGEFSAAALPVVYHDEVVSVVLLVYQGKQPPMEQLRRLGGEMTVAIGHLLGGTHSASIDSLYDQTEPPIFELQKKKVVEILMAERVFSDQTIVEEVDAFYGLGISPLYFAQNNPQQIADHLHAFIAAKKVAMATHQPSINFEHIGEKDATFFCLDVLEEREELLQKANCFVDATESGSACSVTMFRSRLPLLKGHHLIMLTATRSRYPKRDIDLSQPPDIWNVSSASFLRSKSRPSKQRYDAILKKAHGQLHPIAEVRVREPGHVLMLVFPLEAPEEGLRHLFGILDYLQLRCSQLFAETFAHGAVSYNIYLEAVDPNITQEKLDRKLTSLIRRMTTLAVLPLASRVNHDNSLGPRAKLYYGCASIFAYYFLPHMSEDFHALRQFLLKSDSTVALDRLDRLGRHMQKDAVNMHRFNRTLVMHPDLAWKIYDAFLKRFRPGVTEDPGADESLKLEIQQTVQDPLDQQILLSCLLFNSSILKTNFFLREKAATSFRLRGDIVGEECPEKPHGIFLVVGADFQGFHLRFRDISRGGIRMIKSPNQTYHRNQSTLFEENYNLAYTQQLKNKDIPEGGSKGTILLNPDDRAQSRPDDSFKAYIDAILDIILPNEQVVDHLKQKEILFFGPDEGTAGNVVVWAANHAKRRGYPYWKAITTGKPATMGGIPHDTYGMTTRSVHQNVLGVLEALGKKEEEVTKFQTGGPDGDLGSNEILISKDRTVGIVDGSGVLYDPAGINREELTKLAKNRQMVRAFDTSKLGKSGYLVRIEDRGVKLPDGMLVESGLAFRNDYHLFSKLTADLFVPCGGRPGSVNINNVNKMFDTKTGAPRFKYIVEGANLFITPDARRVLEDAGVILMKDATCNKGGVTSSSLEVLASLAMSQEEHTELMCVKSDGTVPEFYKKYVEQVQAQIEENARMEFRACWRERERGTHKYLAVITDLLSKKINSINDMLQNSSLLENEKFMRIILAKALPPLLIEQCGLDQVVKNVPQAYLRAICGAYFASRYVYKYGLSGTEVEVLDFIQSFVKFQV